MRSAAGGARSKARCATASGAHRRQLHGQLLRHAGLAYEGDEQQVLLAVRQRARAVCQALPAPGPRARTRLSPWGAATGAQLCSAARVHSQRAHSHQAARSICPAVLSAAARVAARTGRSHCPGASRGSGLRRGRAARQRSGRWRTLQGARGAPAGNARHAITHGARCAQRRRRARRAPVPRAAGRWRPARRRGPSCAARRARASPRPGLCARV